MGYAGELRVVALAHFKSSFKYLQDLASVNESTEEGLSSLGEALIGFMRFYYQFKAYLTIQLEKDSQDEKLHLFANKALLKVFEFSGAFLNVIVQFEGSVDQTSYDIVFHRHLSIRADIFAFADSDKIQSFAQKLAHIPRDEENT